MIKTHPGFRIFILGAGFSQPAGLPLSTTLFTEVLNCIESRYGLETKLHKDLEDYIEYRKVCDGLDLRADEVNLEELMSFLDIEHFLRLRGSKTWSQEGNEAQLMIRKAIGDVIHKKTPPADCLPDVYYQFAKNLSLHDIVITLNYDILLERALDYIGKPYRLFPHRFSQVGHSANTIDSDVKEIVILKLHGSVDWFDNRQFLESKAYLKESGTTKSRIHSVFDDPKRYDAEPIAQGPRSLDDPLLHIYRIKGVDEYYLNDRDFNAPFILSPSHIKYIYAQPLLSFWEGIGRSGGANLGISIVGFSLPIHDEYIRIVLYQMISNYQQVWWGQSILGVKKDKVRMVDFHSSKKDIAAYKSRYGFVDSSKTEYMFDGFNDESINFLFDNIT